MNELIIELTDISPQEFFGRQNENIELLKKYFPKLKIVARGNKIKVYGDEELLEEFDKRFDEITGQFAKYNKLDENMIERILTSTSEEDYTSSKSCFHPERSEEWRLDAIAMNAVEDAPLTLSRCTSGARK